MLVHKLVYKRFFTFFILDIIVHLRLIVGSLCHENLVVNR